jgi:hypothetical protein
MNDSIILVEENEIFILMVSLRGSKLYLFDNQKPTH